MAEKKQQKSKKKSKNQKIKIMDIEDELRTETESGKLERVKELLLIPGININRFDLDDEENPLLLACWKGHTEVVRILLEDHRIDVNVLNINGLSPLHLAVRENQVEIVKTLLGDERTIVQIKSSQQKISPFQFACFYSRNEIVNVFKELKSEELSTQDIKLGRFVELCVNEMEDNYSEIVELIEEIDINHFFIIACSSGNLKVIEMILSLGNPNLDINFGCWDGVTAFYLACRQNRINIVTFLLTLPTINVNTPTTKGATPFFIACDRCHSEIVKLLLSDKRVDINKGIKSNITPFYNSCRNGNMDIFKLLLQDPRVDLNQSNTSGFTPFSFSCWTGKIQMVKLFLNQKGVDLKKPTIIGATPFYLACRSGHLDIVKLLLKDERIDPNKSMVGGATPFYIACKIGNLEIVKLLLSNEREIDIGVKCRHENRNATEQAIVSSTASRYFWERTEEECQKRQQNCIQIIKTLDQYQMNKEETKFLLKKELGILEEYASEILSLIVLTSDNYLSISK